MITQECIDTYRTNFACKLSCLATQYTDALTIGSNCADKLGIDMIIANDLIKILCITKGDDLDTCLNEQEICKIIEKIKLIFKLNKCEC